MQYHVLQTSLLSKRAVWDLAKCLASQMFKRELCKLLAVGTTFSYSVELLNVSEPQFLHLKSGHLSCFLE